ncbi:MAG: hypothetical protein V4613_04015 [Bacteroidota bacterium]
MLKKIFILGILVIGGLCIWLFYNPLKEPTFVNIKNLVVDTMVGNIASVHGTAVFNNPNKLDAQLLNTELKAFSNDAYIGTVSQTAISTIPGNSDFEIPLTLTVDVLKLGYSQSLSGLLTNALNKQKMIPVKFEGYCRIKILNSVHKIPVTFEDELKFE